MAADTPGAPVNAITPTECPPFDWKNPDYAPVFMERLRRLAWLRERQEAWAELEKQKPDLAGPSPVTVLKRHYREHPADFINDWGVTFDPRNADVDDPTMVPFLLFPKQREFIDYVIGKWRSRRPGLVEKSRDMGVSWVAVALGCTLCLHRDGLNIGYGSRLVNYVDLIGSPKSLFHKARQFMKYLPREFRGGWDEKVHAPLLRITFPETGSTMSGEGGDNVGRGDRATIYFVDEAAHLEHPLLVDAALSQTTNCQIDMSSVNGMGNPFAQKRHSGKIDVFTFHWRDDPRKDETWYAQQKEDLTDVIVAQEIDINYSASATGILVPSAWVQSAIDAHIKLGIEPSGERYGAMDVADGGPDLCAYAHRHGILVKDVTAWSGKEDDIFWSVQKAFDMSDEADVVTWFYDADGLGAGVRGDARVINEQREERGAPPHEVMAFRGSGEVYKKDAPIPVVTPEGASIRDKRARKNGDYFANAKAQAWWELRVRFQRTHRAVQAVAKGLPNEYDPDDLISLDSTMGELTKLTMELSQPTYTQNGVGKIVIDKQPDGTRSPNHGDAVMILFAPRKAGFLSYLG